MIRLWDALVDRLCTKEVGTLLAWFRIALAAIVLVDTALVVAAGAVDPLYIPIADGGLAPADRFLNPFLALFGHSTAMTWGMLVSVFGFGTLVLVGLGGRLSTFGLLQAVLLMHAIPEDIGGGYDRLLTNGLFVLFLGDSTATWSLDCKLRTGSWTSDRPIYALARYVGIAQLITTYIVTGFAKSGDGWAYPYDAVYYALQRWALVRFGELTWLGDAFWLTQIGTVVSWYWEAGFLLLIPWWMAHLGWIGERPRAIADRVDLRWPFLLLGVVTHLVLLVFINVGPFTVVTLAFYLLWLDGRTSTTEPRSVD